MGQLGSMIFRYYFLKCDLERRWAPKAIPKATIRSRKNGMSSGANSMPESAGAAALLLDSIGGFGGI